jgi:hypothetical protein
MAKTIQVSVDTSDLKVLNTHLNNTKKTIKMTAKSAKTDFKQLKMSIDPVYRAEKIFTKQVLVAQKAVATGAISNSEYARTFSIIQKNAQASGMTINQFGQVANVNTRKMKRFGAVGMQQVGYQVQDFAVQVQGGTSAMVALGQQGSQLLGIFGPYGAIAGMILAIGTGLAGAFMAAKNAGDDLVSSAKLFKTAMEESKEAVRELKLENYMLANSIKSVAEAKLVQAIESIKQDKANRKAELQFEIQNRKDSGLGTFAQELELRNLGKGNFAEMGLRSMFNGGQDQRIADLQKQLESVRALLSENKDRKDAVKEFEELVRLGKKTAEVVGEISTQRQNAEELVGMDGRQILILKQEQELRAKVVELRELGINVGQRQFDQAIRDLEIMHAINIAKYDEVEAEKAIAEAKKIAEEAERKKLKAAKAAHEAAKKAAADIIALNKSIGSSMENAMMSMVDGTKSVKDAFKDMAREIIKELYRIYVVKKITGMITGAIEGKFAPDVGATANPHTLANGGTAMAGQRYIVGERGPEVFTPSVSGHVTPNSGGGGSGTTIVQNINVSTGVQQTVRAEIRQMMPQIADSAKGAVLDAKRRGGNYGRAMA